MMHIGFDLYFLSISFVYRNYILKKYKMLFFVVEIRAAGNIEEKYGHL